MAGNIQSVGIHGIVNEGVAIHSGPKGTSTTFTVTCDTAAPLIAYYNTLVAAGAQVSAKGFDVGVDGVTSAAEKRLDVEFPGLPSTMAGVLSELFFDEWELVTNEASDTIFNNPLIFGGSSPAVNQNDKDVLIVMAQYGLAIAAAVSQADSVIPANAPHSLPTAGESLQLALEISKGQTEDAIPTRVLRHSSYCSPGQYYNSVRTNELKIYSTAQLLTEVGSGWTYNLTPRLYSQISAIPIQYAATDEATYYSWGWLKKLGREPVLSNFMVEVSVEYELGLWSNIRYAHA